MKTQLNHQSAVKVHQHLTNLIKERFGVFLEVQHIQYPNGYVLKRGPLAGTTIRAVTEVWAYRTLEDARDFGEPIAHAASYCGMSDQFVRAEGLAIALRRLYRKLAQNQS